MTLAFFLSMPNVGSWNGKWSGEGTLYAITRKVNPAQAVRMDGRSWHYSWSDGWGANVACRLVKGSEIRQIRKNSKGFCGYDWMVESILVRDCIKADHEVKEEKQVPTCGVQAADGTFIENKVTQ